MTTKSKHYDDDGRVKESANTLRLAVKLTNTRNGKTCTVVARPPSVIGGMWVISERARRDACGKLGADWADTNPGIESTMTLRAVDANGWHTFTIYAKAQS